MTLRHISLSVAAAVALTALAGVNPDYDYEILTTTAGEQLYGYPAVQNADGSIVFRSVASRRHIVCDSVTGVFSSAVSRKDLSPEMIESLKNYQAFVGKKSAKFECGNSNLAKPWAREFIVERAAGDVFDILTFTEVLDTIPYELIAKRSSRVAPTGQDYGLLDRITTPKRVYTGRITERVPSKSIVIRNDGSDREISVDDINIIEKVPVDSTVSAVAQSPLLTTLYFDDNSTLTGIELMTNYNTGDLDVMSASDEKIYRKNVDNVVRRENLVNPNYPPKRAPKLDYSDGKVYADTTCLELIEPKLVKEDRVDFDKDPALKEAANVVARNDKGGLKISHKAQLKNVVTLYRIARPDADRSFRKSEIIGGIAPASITTDRDGRTLIDFGKLDSGMYLLSFPADNEFYVVDIR